MHQLEEAFNPQFQDLLKRRAITSMLAEPGPSEPSHLDQLCDSIGKVPPCEKGEEWLRDKYRRLDKETLQRKLNFFIGVHDKNHNQQLARTQISQLKAELHRREAEEAAEAAEGLQGDAWQQQLQQPLTQGPVPTRNPGWVQKVRQAPAPTRRTWVAWRAPPLPCSAHAAAWARASAPAARP